MQHGYLMSGDESWLLVEVSFNLDHASLDGRRQLCCLPLPRWFWRWFGLGHAQGSQFNTYRYGFREELWTRTNYIVYALLLAGRPLHTRTLCPGVRRELEPSAGNCKELASEMIVQDDVSDALDLQNS